MKRVIRVLGYWAIIFSLLFLSSITLAQEGTIESTTEIAQIPAVRIIDWKGETPTVNGLDGWQEQALKVSCDRNEDSGNSLEQRTRVFNIGQDGM